MFILHERGDFYMQLFFIIIFMAILIIIVEMATLILESTGLPKEIARFQAISLLTGTGYTTTEAELITKHPIRRKVAEMLIIFGTLSFAIVIAIFITFLSSELKYHQLAVGILVLSFLFLIFRLRWVQRIILRRMKNRLHPQMTLEEAFQLDDQDMVAEIILTDAHKHLFAPLSSLQLVQKYDIHILTIYREEETGNRINKQLIKHPTGSIELKSGDKLLLFGTKKHMEEVFGRSLQQYKT